MTRGVQSRLRRSALALKARRRNPVATTGIDWGKDFYYDRHVLRGKQTRPLVRGLFLNQDAGPPVPADSPNLPADVAAVRLLPAFKAPPPAPLDTVVAAHGVRVDIKTGAVTALSEPPPLPQRLVTNFLV